MVGKRRTRVEILKTRADVARLYLQGWPQKEIAVELGLSEATVSRDLRAQRAAWLVSAAVDFDEAKARELAKLDAIEREAWAAWEASKAEGQSKTTSGGEGLPARASITKWGREGNERYLKIVLECIDKRMKILGLVVEKHEHFGKDGGPVQVRSTIDGMKDLFQMMRQREKDGRTTPAADQPEQ